MFNIRKTILYMQPYMIFICIYTSSLAGWKTSFNLLDCLHKCNLVYYTKFNISVLSGSGLSSI
jgi:hypothetical protein